MAVLVCIQRGHFFLATLAVLVSHPLISSVPTTPKSIYGPQSPLLGSKTGLHPGGSQYTFLPTTLSRQSTLETHSVCACSVVSNFLRPHGLYSARLLCPWGFPGKNTGVGCHFILQQLHSETHSSTQLMQKILWLKWFALRCKYWKYFCVFHGCPMDVFNFKEELAMTVTYGTILG